MLTGSFSLPLNQFPDASWISSNKLLMITQDASKLETIDQLPIFKSLPLVVMD